MPLRRPTTVVCLLLLAVALPACGSGGSGTPADASLLSGPYFVVYFGADDDMPDYGTAVWGVGTADGMGGLSAMIGTNIGGGVSGPLGAPFEYTVAANRAFSSTIAGATQIGWVRSDGALAVGGSFTDGVRPSVIAFLKLGSGFDDGSLLGEYHVCASGVLLGGDAVAYWGTAEFDGLGGCDVSFGANIEGMPIMPGGAMSAPYSVASNGQFTQTIGAEDLEGAILAGGDLLLATGSSEGMEFPFLMVFVRKSGGATTSTLSGDYQIIGIERAGGGFRSVTGLADVDGMGALTASLQADTDGVLSVDPPTATGYSVAADSTLVADPAGVALLGGVSPNGDFAIVAGPSTANEPALYLLMRR